MFHRFQNKAPTLAVSTLLAGSLLLGAPVTFARADKQNRTVRAKITFSDDRVQTVMVSGTGGAVVNPNQLVARTDSESDLVLRLDNVHQIKDATNEGVLVVLKNGQVRSLKFNTQRKHLFFTLSGVGRESVRFSQLKTVEFLPAPRRDSQGNPMLDRWNYSPYTGETLDAVRGSSPPH